MNRWGDAKRCFAYCGDDRCDCDARPNPFGMPIVSDEEAARCFPTLAQTPRGALDVIVDWYRALPVRARTGLSLAQLHDLSKRLKASQTSVPSDGEARQAEGLQATEPKSPTQHPAKGTAGEVERLREAAECILISSARAQERLHSLPRASDTKMAERLCTDRMALAAALGRKL